MNSTISRLLRSACLALLAGATAVSAQETGTVIKNNVNVRGRAGFIGEVITRLNQGDQVEVLSEVKLSSTKSGEPAEWYKIALPENTMVWVHASFVDPTTGQVTASRLKVRGGPGINYSVLGLVENGTIVTETSRKGDWMEIAPTDNLYAFVASSTVELDNPRPEVAQSAVPEQDETSEPVTSEAMLDEESLKETELVVEETALPANEIESSETEPIKEANPGSETTIVADPAPVIDETDPTADRPLSEEERMRLALEQHTRDGQYWIANNDLDAAVLAHLPEYRREVTREGYIGGNLSIQAPSAFSLKSRHSNRKINYVFTSDESIPLEQLRGRLVRIEGEEGIDKRWPKTPVLLIKTIRQLD